MPMAGVTLAVGMLQLLPLQARTNFVVFIARLSRTAKVRLHDPNPVP